MKEVNITRTAEELDLLLLLSRVCCSSVVSCVDIQPNLTVD